MCRTVDSIPDEYLPVEYQKKTMEQTGCVFGENNSWSNQNIYYTYEMISGLEMYHSYMDEKINGGKL